MTVQPSLLMMIQTAMTVINNIHNHSKYPIDVIIRLWDIYFI